MRRMLVLAAAVSCGLAALAGCSKSEGTATSAASPLPLQTSDCRDWRSANADVRVATTRYDLTLIRSSQQRGTPSTAQVSDLVTATTAACKDSDAGYATLYMTQTDIALKHSANFLG